METDNYRFQAYPKTPRLFREVIITEKLDGTNAQILVEVDDRGCHPALPVIARRDGLVLLAGLRNRWITPLDDNYGFAKWAFTHKDELFTGLGPGRHFGEWWGGGIQRDYGLAGNDKRFSLFNINRWCEFGKPPARIPKADPRIEKFQEVLPECCSLVPVLHRGPFDTEAVMHTLLNLRNRGSAAVPGYRNPEGIVVFHTAANRAFKVLLENDESSKGEQP